MYDIIQQKYKEIMTSLKEEFSVIVGFSWFSPRILLCIFYTCWNIFTHICLSISLHTKNKKHEN